MTDAEIAALVVRLNANAATIKSRFPAQSITVKEGATALQGLVAERTLLMAQIASITTDRDAISATLQTERDAWQAERVILQASASGQLYRDIAYGLKNNLSSIGTMPSMIAMMKAVDELPAV